jgi:hypothetical protein
MSTVFVQLLAYFGGFTIIGYVIAGIIKAVDSVKDHMKKRETDWDKIQRKLDAIQSDIDDILRQTK